MPVDWSKYPPLPEPPRLPEWRDTPEREACRREMAAVSDPCDGNTGCVLFLAVLLAEAAVLYVIFGRDAFGFIFAGLGLIGALIIWFVIGRLWILVREMKIARRHGMFYPFRLKHRNIDPEIRAALAGRPTFDPAEFRKYWPSPEHAGMAEKLLDIASHYWRSAGKMLYPNDPLHLYFFGRTFFFRRQNRSITVPDAFFYEDVLDDLDFGGWDKITSDSTLAELVEACLETAEQRDHERTET